MLKYPLVPSIFILIVSCYFYFYPKTIQSFINNKNNDNNKQIVLLGDSILNNKKYVYANESVEDYLKQTYPNLNNLATDGAKINDLHDQLNKLNTINISKDSSLIISIGGNDLLDTQNTQTLFKQYKQLLSNILTDYPYIHIYLLNIYYPPCCRFKRYYNVITQWNNLLSSLKSSNIKIILISEILTEKDDFVFEIEPSNKGGKKLANKIIEII
jgi:hypothetical protein